MQINYDTANPDAAREFSVRFRSIIINIILSMVLAVACRPKPPETVFTQMPPSYTHVHFFNKLRETEKINMIKYLYFNNGGGVAAGDINNDGLIDLYFTSNMNGNHLYLNKGNLKFEDITKKAGVEGAGNWSTGVTMADINGDGLLDIYVCCVSNYLGLTGHNLLFINNGNLTFTEQSHEYGLDFSGFSTQAAFFDYDQDGDLDLYLLNHSVHSSRTHGPATLRYDFDPYAGDRLFRNVVDNGRKYFLDVTRRIGIYSSQIGYGLGVSIGDVNNDGYPDIYIDNDFHEQDYLYINNRDGTFYDQLPQMLEHTSQSSMGNDMADFNNDGRLDICTLDMLPEDETTRKRSGGDDEMELYQLKLDYGYYFQNARNMLQLNLGDNHFAEIGRLSGIYSTDWSWSPLFCDLDNDGYKDLYITNGIYRRANDLDYISSLTQKNTRGIPLNDMRNPDNVLYEKMPLSPQVNYVFRNNGDLTFTNEAEAWGMGIKSYSNGACYADLDNDGDLDLVINNINQDALIYRNNVDHFTKNNFVEFDFKGPEENRSGIGARVTVYSGGKIQMAENYTTRGFESAVPPELHFGTGPVARLDSVIVRWPGGNIQILNGVETGRKITLDIKDSTTPPGPQAVPAKEYHLFSKALDINGLGFRHTENSYSELSKEWLIPHTLSNEGPCVAIGDVNGDHRDDIFFGNAKGHPSVLLVQEASGFRAADEKLFAGFAGYEDVDAAFFDADNDGDLDLYVVSGGDESSGTDPMGQDRMYVNDGHGNFTYNKHALPEFYHNGSCVRPADFDHDGDMDLFVGSRSVPGSYGLTPRSYLLKNNGVGVFTDVTDQVANHLGLAGMVTDAAWTDIDGNQYPDLVVAGEWMPIIVFLNRDGKKLTEDQDNGLEKSAGWWFCLKAADIDHDGDMDLLAGNLGLNAGIRCDSTHPARIYINDFDNNGLTDPVITWNRNGKNFPIATIDQLVRQIGSLDKKYPTYASMAGKTVEEIFPPDKLGSSVMKSAYNFKSGIFLNQGKGRFRFMAFPAETQFSPVMSILADDFDKDGNEDLLIAGNLYEVRPSVGRMDASFGWLLKGQGQDNFKIEWPGKSGWFVRGETRKLAELKVKGGKIVIAGVNNSDAQFFRVNSK